MWIANQVKLFPAHILYLFFITNEITKCLFFDPIISPEYAENKSLRLASTTFR